MQIPPATADIRKAMNFSAVTRMFAILAAFAAAAWAQQPAAVPPAASAPVRFEGLGVEQAAAHRLLQLARWTLSEPHAAHPSRLAAAQTLLRHATGLDPRNGDLWRFRGEAELLAGDRAAARLCLSEYLKIDPRDDAAQLRLIEMLIEEAQTAAARLTICKRMIEGSLADQLSPALRSRVALHAADLCTELGDSRGFAEHLKKALSLDETNAEAAEQAYQFLIRRGAGRLEQAQALFNLASADPTRSDQHLNIARLMLECGQYEKAAAWYDTASRIWNAGDGPPAGQLAGIVADWATALWGMGRPADAQKLIAGVLAPAAANQPVPAELAAILAAIPAVDGRADLAAAEADKLLASLQAILESPAAGPRQIADLIWAQLLFDRSIDKAAESLAKLAPSGAVDEATIRRLNGWLLLRQGKSAEARAALEPLAENDPAAEYGLAITEIESAAVRKLQRLNRVASSTPQTVLGVMAAQKMAGLKARPQMSADALNIARLEGQIPPRVRKVVNPGQFLVMRLRSIKPSYAWDEPIELEIELMNVSGAALSLGKGRTAPANVLLVMNVTGGGRAIGGSIMHVVDLERRLRLEAGASITVRSRIDAGSLGLALSIMPAVTAEIRATAILNPVPGAKGFAAGLMGSSQTVRDILRPGWVSTNASLVQLVNALNGNDPAAALHAATQITALLPLTKVEGLAAAEVTASKLVEAYERSSPAAKATILAYMSGSDRASKLFEKIISSAINGNDPMLTQVLLTSTVRKSDSTLLSAALRKEPGPIRDYAQHWRQVVELLKTQPQASPVSEDKPE